MQRLKKIRGQKRLKRRIEKWRLNSLPIDLQEIQAKNYGYVKIWVSPFDNLRYKERNYIGPKSETRILLLSSLLDIYDSWDLELKKLGTPYYLSIWLYEPRFTSSQVVCGIYDRINHYENSFSVATKEVQFPTQRYKPLKDRLEQFKWTIGVDEEIIDNDFLAKEQYFSEQDFFADQKMFQRLEKKEIKRIDLTEESRKLIRYFLPKGYVWIGRR